MNLQGPTGGVGQESSSSFPLGVGSWPVRTLPHPLLGVAPSAVWTGPSPRHLLADPHSGQTAHPHTQHRQTLGGGASYWGALKATCTLAK